MTLSASTLRKLLTPHLNLSEWDLLFLDKADSTNTFLKTYPLSRPYTLCCADTQTAGRGRQGRQWYAEPGKNLTFSLCTTLHFALSELQTLSLVVGVACAQALAPTLKVQLKWPNDLFFNGEKLGGILVEILKTQPTQTTVIIGIGLNVNHTPASLDAQSPATCLYEHTRTTHDRHQILSKILITLTQTLQLYEKKGWAAFHSQWNESDYLVGKLLAFKQGEKKIQGFAKGVDAYGRLIIENENEQRLFLTSGDVERL